jgi:hypothetical protein
MVCAEFLNFADMAGECTNGLSNGICLIVLPMSNGLAHPTDVKKEVSDIYLYFCDPFTLYKIDVTNLFVLVYESTSFLLMLG